MSRCQRCRRDLVLVGDRWVHPDREGLERHLAEPGRISIGALPDKDPDHVRAPHPVPVEPAREVSIEDLCRPARLLAGQAAWGWDCQGQHAVGYVTVGHPSREEYRLATLDLVLFRCPEGAAVACWVDGRFDWGIVVQPDATVTWRPIGFRELKGYLCPFNE